MGQAGQHCRCHAGRRNIYQSIFLDDMLKQHWTVGDIDPVRGMRRGCCRCPAGWRRSLALPCHTAQAAISSARCVTQTPCLLSPQSKILKQRTTRQFAHTWRHFATWVPWVSARSWWYAAQLLQMQACFAGMHPHRLLCGCS